MMLLPLAAFFVLVIIGVWLNELSVRQALALVAVWAIGIALFNAFGWPRQMFITVEVVLDVILILMIFGGDLRIR